MKPNQEKKKTRPYILIGFRPGMERALWLMGLTTGAVQRVVGLNMMALEDEKCSSSTDAEVVNGKSCQDAV
jgi:hypothetical protein